MKIGTVLLGINNIYTVSTGNKTYECRIKGKKLKASGNEYNPIVAGDSVEIEVDTHSPDQGLVTRKITRNNAFIRWNNKKRAPQSIAANIDLLVCISSPDSPPFRPRFIDRVIAAAGTDIPVVIVLNKSDLSVSDKTLLRLHNYGEIGYKYLFCSARTGKGLKKLRSIIKGKRSAFVGQSGVGKSSILNKMFPTLNLRVGEISEKYNRGRHTTNYAILIPVDGFEIVDTPGIREISIALDDLSVLSGLFTEFSNFSTECSFNGCLHVYEPDCGVRKAALEGDIHPDRYESYLRIITELESRILKSEKNTKRLFKQSGK